MDCSVIFLRIVALLDRPLITFSICEVWFRATAFRFIAFPREGRRELWVIADLAEGTEDSVRPCEPGTLDGSSALMTEYSADASAVRVLTALDFQLSFLFLREVG